MPRKPFAGLQLSDLHPCALALSLPKAPGICQVRGKTRATTVFLSLAVSFHGLIGGSGGLPYQRLENEFWLQPALLHSKQQPLFLPLPMLGHQQPSNLTSRFSAPGQTSPPLPACHSCFPRERPFEIKYRKSSFLKRLQPVARVLCVLLT